MTAADFPNIVGTDLVRRFVMENGTLVLETQPVLQGRQDVGVPARLGAGAAGAPDLPAGRASVERGQRSGARRHRSTSGPIPRATGTGS